MKLKLHQELTDDEIERLASRDPLPDFDSQEDELWLATQHVKNTARSIACIAMGLSSGTIKQEWKRARQHILERKRRDAWDKRHQARFDQARQKYMIFNPEPGSWFRLP
jgi:hypothetical protein